MWNTWSFEGNTRFVHNTAYFEFIIGIINRKKNKVWIKFIHGTGVPDKFIPDHKNMGAANVDIAKGNPKYLGKIEKYGPHDKNMHYMNLIIKGDQNKYLIEASGIENKLNIKVSVVELK
ncbi:MAG: hypothetical protein ACTSVK_12920, partial [Promethearchaeota archaeon]